MHRGDGLTDDEEPPPRFKPARAIEPALDARRDKAAECARQERAGVEKGGPEGELSLRVPGNGRPG